MKINCLNCENKIYIYDVKNIIYIDDFKKTKAELTSCVICENCHETYVYFTYNNYKLEIDYIYFKIKDRFAKDFSFQIFLKEDNMQSDYIKIFGIKENNKLFLHHNCEIDASTITKKQIFNLIKSICLL